MRMAEASGRSSGTLDLVLGRQLDDGGFADPGLIAPPDGGFAADAGPAERRKRGAPALRSLNGGLSSGRRWPARGVLEADDLTRREPGLQRALQKTGADSVHTI